MIGQAYASKILCMLTDRQTDKQTDKDAQRQTEAKTDRDKDKRRKDSEAHGSNQPAHGETLTHFSLLRQLFLLLFEMKKVRNRDDLIKGESSRSKQQTKNELLFPAFLRYF